MSRGEEGEGEEETVVSMSNAERQFPSHNMQISVAVFCQPFVDLTGKNYS